MGERELVLAGEGCGHGDLDPPAADPDEGADLEEAQADRAASRLGELGVGEADAAQRAEQDPGSGLPARGQAPAMEANQSRSWLAFIVAVEVRSAPGSGRQQTPTAEHVQGQIAAAAPPVGPWAAGGQAP